MAKPANIASQLAGNKTEEEDEELNGPGVGEKRKVSRLRMTVDFHPKVATRLVWLKEETEAPSFVEVLRDAINYYALLVQAFKRGARVEIVEEDGQRRVVTGPIQIAP